MLNGLSDYSCRWFRMWRVFGRASVCADLLIMLMYSVNECYSCSPGPGGICYSGIIEVGCAVCGSQIFV